MSVVSETIPPSIISQTYVPSTSSGSGGGNRYAQGPASTSEAPANSHELSDSEAIDYDERDELLSEVTSDTTFFDEEASQSRISFATTNSKDNLTARTSLLAGNRNSHNNLTGASNASDVMKDIWSFTFFRMDGKVAVIGEWVAKTKSFRYAVIGPDWPCVLVTYVFIIVPSVCAYVYLVQNLIEEIIFLLLFGLCIFGLTTVVFIDPGLVRKYHHARSRHWTYCDHCESFRPPQTVHCSTCHVCISGYDHHCPWTGKCIGHGNIIYFKIFVVSLSWLVVYVILLGILLAAKVT